MKKASKILMRVILGILVLIIIIAAFLFFKADDLATGYLQKFFDSQPVAGHILGFSGFQFTEDGRSLEIDDLYILPDTASSDYEDLARNGFLLNLTVKSIRVKGIRFTSLLFGHVLKLDSLVIDGPNGSMIFGKKEQEQESNPEMDPETNAKTRKKAFFNMIKVNAFSLVNGELQAMGNGGADSLYSTRGLEFKISSIIADLENMQEPSRSITFDEFYMATEYQKVTLPGNFYDLEIKSLDISENNSSIRIDSLNLIPRYSKADFGWKFGRQMDRFDVTVGEIVLEGLDIQEFLKSGSVYASKLEVTRAHADIYRDKNVPRKDEKIKPLLNKLLLDVKSSISIDSVIFDDAYVKYGEVPPDGTEAGTIYIDHFDLLATNVTNLKDRIAANPAMDLSGTFMLEGVGKTDLHISFPMDRPSEKYSYTLELQKMPLSKLNPMLKPSANIEVFKGELVRAMFEVQADDDLAEGRAYMQYYGLEMEILKKNQKENKDGINKFFSKLANALIHNDNPSKKTQVERVGLIKFEREKYRSNIGYLVKPLIHGMIQILSPDDMNVEKIDHSSSRKQEGEESAVKATTETKPAKEKRAERTKKKK